MTPAPAVIAPQSHILPLKTLLAPSVVSAPAEEAGGPITQKILQALAPFLRITVELAPVTRAPSMIMMNWAVETPPASKVTEPLAARLTAPAK